MYISVQTCRCVVSVVSWVCRISWTSDIPSPDRGLLSGIFTVIHKQPSNLQSVPIILLDLTWPTFWSSKHVEHSYIYICNSLIILELATKPGFCAPTLHTSRRTLARRSAWPSWSSSIRSYQRRSTHSATGRRRGTPSKCPLNIELFWYTCYAEKSLECFWPLTKIVKLSL